MEIETAVFAKAKPNLDALSRYGFVRVDRGFSYRETFFDGEFEAQIFVSDEGKVEGKVIEVALEEEYAPLRIDSFGGGYVGSVREAYRDLLKSIKVACFTETRFLSSQANRIVECIFATYGESPDFPWDESSGVFRFPENRKWYGLIMDIPKSRLTHREEDEETVNVMNLKANGQTVEELCHKPGVFPAYHMNHDKWISVVLDDSLSDGEVMALIDASRVSILPKKKAQK